jgi:small-conductance mechanosensitive channel
MNNSKNGLAKIIGQAIFYASIQAAFGSVEMSSKFSVINFSKDQETLQNAADALRHYLYIAAIWTIATMLVMYGNYGWCGAILGFIFNLFMMAWIYLSYSYAFKKAANKSDLELPTVFKF